MVKKATTFVFVMLLLGGLITLISPQAKAQTATPSQAVISVSGVPAGTKALAVEVTVDTAVINLGAVTTDNGIAFSDMGSLGVGVFSDMDLSASFNLTVALTGIAAGTSMVSVGKVLDKLGGTEIAGATATVDASSVTVASSSSTTSSSSSSSTGGAGGNLSSDTITVTINGDAVNATNGLVATLSFSDPTVAVLDTAAPTFMGTGATQLLSAADATVSTLTAVWDGTITDGAAVLTAMLKPGTMAGTTTVSVSKVEVQGGTDVTANIAATVSPNSITNSGGGSMTDVGTFTLIGPSSVTGPGKVAIAFSAEGAASNLTATLNGAMVDFVESGVGIAIVDVPASGSLALMLVASGTEVDLGSVSVTAGSGKAPKVATARASNKSSGTKLTIAGKKFSKTETTVEIVPTDRSSSSEKASGKSVKATYDAAECIPSGSYVNVSTSAGTSAKKIKVSGSCSNSLVD